MAKLSGYRKCIKWFKEASGFRKVSIWASASSIENADGTTVEDKLTTVVKNLASHVSSKGNAHGLSKSDIGLGNVDNTADANKSVKYATSAGTANEVAWGNITGKPNSYVPDSHNHNDTYYTKQEIDDMLLNYLKAKLIYDNTTNTLTISDQS